ncbi:hypothetical protein Tco_0360518 [Tanacetum coccineum]
MAVRTQPTLSLGMSARIAEAAALSSSSFRKRYRSSYKTSSSSSSTLPGRKRYRGTSELILDTDSEGDELGEEDTEEDEEDESSDADDERERESQGLDEEGHGLGDEDHGLGDESQGLEGEGLGLEEEEAAPESQQQARVMILLACTVFGMARVVVLLACPMFGMQGLWSCPIIVLQLVGPLVLCHDALIILHVALESRRYESRGSDLVEIAIGQLQAQLVDTDTESDPKEAPDQD